MFVQPTASSHWIVGIALIYDTTTIAYAPSVHVSIACMLIVTILKSLFLGTARMNQHHFQYKDVKVEVEGMNRKWVLISGSM